MDLCLLGQLCFRLQDGLISALCVSDAGPGHALLIAGGISARDQQTHVMPLKVSAWKWHFYPYSTGQSKSHG